MTPDTRELHSFDPWDNTLVGTFPVATGSDVAEAVRRARGALRGWGESQELRRQVIRTLADVIKRRRSELATLISRETGKVFWESLLEADAMANKCGLSLRAEEERRTPTSKTTPTGTLSTTYRPHGVALVLGPFNFPGHLPLGHIAPALLAGNTVIFKPSEKAPAVAALLVELFTEAGLPPDVLQVLHGGGDVAVALIESDIDAVFFTGSYKVGTSILSRLTHRPGVICALEMGGNNPLIAWDIAPEQIDAAVLNIIQSAFATGGQRCSCARRLLLPQRHALYDRLAAAVRQVQVGKWNREPVPFHGTQIDAQAARNTVNCALGLIDGGGQMLTPLGNNGYDTPALLPPALIDVTRARHADEEVFGPLLLVQTVESFDEALMFANATKYGLVAGLLTDNLALWDRVRLEARAGVLTLNRPTTGASSELPFGGIGNSGNHRPSAYFAADYCSHPVAEMSTPTLTLPDKLPPGITL